MNITLIPGAIYKWSFPEYHKLNKEIINIIDSRVSTPVFDKGDSISDTDFFTYSWEKEAPYMAILRPYIDKCLKEFTKSSIYGSKNGDVLYLDNHWFQQYNKGDRHSWHTHGKCTYSSVYYVELPNSSIGTKFIGPNGPIDIKVQEGDFILFPSYLSHCSPINLSDSRKTVISINLTTNG